MTDLLALDVASTTGWVRGPVGYRMNSADYWDWRCSPAGRRANERAMQQHADEQRRNGAAAMTKMPFVCSKNTPWLPSMGTPVVHADAQEVGEQRVGRPGGDIVTYKCPHCGHSWEAELPQ